MKQLFLYNIGFAKERMENILDLSLSKSAWIKMHRNDEDFDYIVDALSMFMVDVMTDNLTTVKSTIDSTYTDLEKNAISNMKSGIERFVNDVMKVFAHGHKNKYLYGFYNRDGKTYISKLFFTEIIWGNFAQLAFHYSQIFKRQIPRKTFDICIFTNYVHLYVAEGYFKSRYEKDCYKSVIFLQTGTNFTKEVKRRRDESIKSFNEKIFETVHDLNKIEIEDIIREKVILNEVNDKGEWKAFDLGNYPSIPDVIDRAKSYGFKYILGTDGYLHTI